VTEAGDPYELLGVPRSATVDDFKKSLRLLAKKLYPDANQNDPSAAVLFPEIKAAREILGDEAADGEAKSALNASTIAVSEFTFSMTALLMAAAIIAAVPLIVRSPMPQMGINATSDGGHLALSRVVANEERPDPRLWSESLLEFKRLPESSADKALVTAAETNQSAQNTPDSQHDHEPIALLIGRSERLISEGDVEAARILLQRAAEAHDARAALALGATYDPIMLTILQTHRVAADVSTALDWYKKASKFGSQEAQERLRLLAAVLVEPKRRLMGAPIHVAVSHEAVPRAAAPTHDRNGVGAAGIRVGAISDRSIRPQLVRDDVSQKLPALFGVNY
jgi:TPR repeat protein